ncbi:MAG: pyruvate dehydrogenase (acetyl-transferring) E1 component subunit alpha [Phycisphaerae bacterium]|nr:pyruvate dehydrogenase (acetyl-transferring) E1 component subunit alpha [Phycisphaerae bacterium]
MSTTETANHVVENTVPVPDPEILKSWLRDMLQIREFEVRSMQAYQNKLAGGFLHVYNGQEAVAVGCIAAMQPTDPVITAYRDHGHALARGLDPKIGFAELFGRIDGCAKGKGGSMHFFDRDNYMFGGHGIVGAQCPLGTGLAFATKYNDEVVNGGTSRSVTACFLGDGALNQGSVHEAMNLAMVLDLPIVFCVENNRYAMGTAVDRCTASGNQVTNRAVAFGMEARSIGGMDVIEVYREMKDIVDHVRATSKPYFVDIDTYRFKGHSMSDPRKYRTHEEEQEFEADDPIEKLTRYLLAQKVITEEELKALSKQVRHEIREAVNWARQSPNPDVSELHHDVYADTWGEYTGTSLPRYMRPAGEQGSSAGGANDGS